MEKSPGLEPMFLSHESMFGICLESVFCLFILDSPVLSSRGTAFDGELIGFLGSQEFQLVTPRIFGAFASCLVLVFALQVLSKPSQATRRHQTRPSPGCNLLHTTAEPVAALASTMPTVCHSGSRSLLSLSLHCTRYSSGSCRDAAKGGQHKLTPVGVTSSKSKVLNGPSVFQVPTAPRF